LSVSNPILFITNEGLKDGYLIINIHLHMQEREKVGCKSHFTASLFSRASGCQVLSHWPNGLPKLQINHDDVLGGPSSKASKQIGVHTL